MSKLRQALPTTTHLVVRMGNASKFRRCGIDFDRGNTPYVLERSKCKPEQILELLNTPALDVEEFSKAPELGHRGAEAAPPAPKPKAEKADKAAKE